MEVVSALEWKGQGYSLKVKIEDGTDIAVGVLSNEVIENMIGMSSEQAKKCLSNPATVTHRNFFNIPSKVLNNAYRSSRLLKTQKSFNKLYIA